MSSPLFRPIRRTQGGFRLIALEVFNWGTFNSTIWSIKPDGANTLLTGANGSGKSTLIDAILTLLVPSSRRGYNQASGDSAKRERNEASYVRGAFSNMQNEEGKSVSRYLRGEADYSVLLARFANATTRVELTLAQVFWHDQGSIKKLFVTSHKPLSIAGDFTSFETPRRLRETLRARGATVYDEFSRYCAELMLVFGLRSEKALDLFNQTVAIKEIGGLNTFVRDHMLEKVDVAERVAQLRQNFDNLTRAHDAMLRAEAQLALLRPLLASADQHAEATRRLEEQRLLEGALPALLARRVLALIAQAHALHQQQLAAALDRQTAAAAQLQTQNARFIELSVAIGQNSASQRLRDIERELAQLESSGRARRQAAERVARLTSALEIAAISDDASFHAARAAAQRAQRQVEQQQHELTNRRDTAVRERTRHAETVEQLSQELRSLRQRTTQIPEQDIALRQRIATDLALDVAELPFSGELLRVRPEEQRWEPAIERLLRGFGRQLLVPESLYQRVSDHINKTDLRGRLVFLRVGTRRPVGGQLDPAALPHKLDVKPDHPLATWLRTELAEGFGYVCTDDMERFRHEPRALTSSGLIRSGTSRHEKDDRSPIGDRRSYVLGWDNKEKIAQYEADQQAAEARRSAANQQVTRLDAEIRQLGERVSQLRELLQIESFAALDWQQTAAEQTQLRAEQEQLTSSSNELRQLQTQLEALRATIKATEAAKQQADKAVFAAQRALEDLAQLRTDAGRTLGGYDPAQLDRAEPLFAPLLKDRPLDLTTIRASEDELRRSLRASFSPLQGEVNKTRSETERRMNEYRASYPADTTDIGATVEDSAEYRRMLAAIERDDLPKHAGRFKALLNDKVVADIASFQANLETTEEQIRASIAALNRSLERIDYTPATYIELRADRTRNVEVQGFRAALRACIPDIGAPSAAANEQSYQRIRELIKRFEEDPRWTQKVIDVRQWLDFSAAERYKSDGVQKDFYADSAGKSGGQKAKLAYTVLASAIAYQYGLEEDSQRAQTFRFVVVDEAFSKSDETNARYAMELFRQLNLQLLVVTPLDKTHVVEPYIGACHLVLNNADENDSRVFDLTIGELRRRRDASENEQP